MNRKEGSGVLLGKRRHIGKYRDIFTITMRETFVYLPAFLVQNIFFIIILFIFFSLWRVIYAGREMIAGFTMVQTLWYLGFTEVIELSKARLVPEIQTEVKDGSIAYSLTRPYSWVLFKISRSMGESVVKIAPMMIEGFVMAVILVGGLPGYGRSLPFGLILILGGVLLNTLWQLLIGLAAFWMEEAMPLYWIFQKLVFIIGGMFFPIDFFPEWLQGTAKALPFAFSAYWPARIMVAFDIREFLYALAGQAAYVFLLGAAAAIVFRRAVRKVHMQGG